MAGLRDVLVSFGMEVDKGSEQQVQGSLDRVVGLAKKAAAAFAAFKVGQMAAGFVENIRGMGDELDKTSIQIGLTTAQLQELRHAANLAGVDGAAFSNSLGRLQKNAYEAASGNKTLKEDFDKLGVSLTDAQGNLKSADLLLEEMADGLNNLDNESEKVALSLNLMGRTGRRLLPLFATGAKGLKAAREETKKLGVGISQDVINKSVALTDNQARAELAILSLKNVLANELIPIFNEFALATIEVAVAFRGPLKRGIEAVKTVARGIQTAIKAVTDQFDTLGNTILGLSVAFGALGAIFALTGKTGFIAGLKAAAGWIAATLPAILMIALIAAIGAAIFLLIEDFQKMGEGAESVTGTIIQGFNELVDELGSIPAAIDEMLRTAAAFWLKRFGDMLGFSEETVANLEATFGSLLQTTIAFWANVGEAIQAAWKSVTDAISAAWEAVVDAMDFAFGGAVRAIIHGIQAVVALLMGDFDAAAEHIVVALENAWQQAKNSFTILTEYLSMVWEFWTSTVPEAVATAMGFTWNIIKTTFSTLFDWLLTAWKFQWDLVVQVVQFAFEGLKSWFGGFFDFIGGLWNTAIQYWKDLINAFLFNGITNDIIDGFKGAFDKVKQLVSDVIGWMKSEFDAWLQRMQPIFGFFQKIGKALSFKNVGGFFKDLFTPETEEEKKERWKREVESRETRSHPAGRSWRQRRKNVPDLRVAPPPGGAAPGAPGLTVPGAEGAPGVPGETLRETIRTQFVTGMGAETPREAGAMLATGAANLAAVSPATAAAPLAGPTVVTPPGGVAGGPSVTNSPTTNIDVSVDATGREGAADIAEQVARQVDTALERRDRQTLRAFTTAVAAGGA